MVQPSAEMESVQQIIEERRNIKENGRKKKENKFWIFCKQDERKALVPEMVA
jgi:hypothetical protein